MTYPLSSSMKMNAGAILALLLCMVAPALAQKPFMEGVIVYKVKLATPDKHYYDGEFTFTIKDGCIRKELKLSNNYQYILLINTANNTAYSLVMRNGRKYAVQLKTEELENNQRKYEGFVLKEERNTGKVIAGYTVFKGSVTYADGSSSEIYSTPDWYPEKSLTYDHFPGAKFLPLSYTYKDESGSSMQFEAETVSISAVENSMFKLPSDYKIISNNEYKQLRK